MRRRWGEVVGGQDCGDPDTDRGPCPAEDTRDADADDTDRSAVGDADDDADAAPCLADGTANRSDADDGTVDGSADHTEIDEQSVDCAARRDASWFAANENVTPGLAPQKDNDRDGSAGG